MDVWTDGWMDGWIDMLNEFAGRPRVECRSSSSRRVRSALPAAAQAADVASRRVGGGVEDAGDGRVVAHGHDQRQRLRRVDAVRRQRRRRWRQTAFPLALQSRSAQVGSRPGQTPRRSARDGRFLPVGNVRRDMARSLAHWSLGDLWEEISDGGTFPVEHFQWNISNASGIWTKEMKRNGL